MHASKNGSSGLACTNSERQHQFVEQPQDRLELPAEPLEVQLVGVARQHESRTATLFPDDHLFDGGIRREDVAPRVGDRLVGRLELKIPSEALDERRRAQAAAVVVLFE